jgi:hypothetical protein
MKTTYAILAATMFVASLLAAEPPAQTPAPSPAPATATTPAPAPNPSDIVYVTASGKKYHKQTCRYAKNATPMTRKEAEAKGLTPCKVCKAAGAGG